MKKIVAGILIFLCILSSVICSVAIVRVNGAEAGTRNSASIANIQ